MSISTITHEILLDLFKDIATDSRAWTIVNVKSKQRIVMHNTSVTGPMQALQHVDTSVFPVRCSPNESEWAVYGPRLESITFFRSRHSGEIVPI